MSWFGPTWMFLPLVSTKDRERMTLLWKLVLPSCTYQWFIRSQCCLQALEDASRFIRLGSACAKGHACGFINLWWYLNGARQRCGLTILI